MLDLALPTSIRRFSVLLGVLLLPAMAPAIGLSPDDILVSDSMASGGAAILRVDPVTGEQPKINAPCGGSSILGTPTALAIDASGDLLVTDTGADAIFRVDPVGGVQTLVSSGEAAHRGGPARARARRLVPDLPGLSPLLPESSRPITGLHAPRGGASPSRAHVTSTCSPSSARPPASVPRCAPHFREPRARLGQARGLGRRAARAQPESHARDLLALHAERGGG